MYDYLRSHKIYAQIHYIPVHTLPYYRALSDEKIYLEHTEAYYDKCISLPMYPTLTDEEQDFVINTVLGFEGLKG